MLLGSEILIHERRVPLDNSRGTSTKFRTGATYVLYKHYDVRELPYSNTAADLIIFLGHGDNLKKKL